MMTDLHTFSSFAYAPSLSAYVVRDPLQRFFSKSNFVMVYKMTGIETVQIFIDLLQVPSVDLLD